MKIIPPASSPDPPHDVLEVPSVEINPRVRPLAPLGVRVLRLLSRTQREWVRNADIATALTESEGGKLKFTLADLTERGWLEAGPAGYRLTLPEGASAGDYRAALLVWLTQTFSDVPDEQEQLPSP